MSAPVYRYFADVGGWRFVVLFHHGRKWLKLLDTATLEIYRLPVRDLARLQPYGISRRELARRIAARRKLFEECGVSFPKSAVAEAIRAIRHGDAT